MSDTLSQSAGVPVHAEGKIWKPLTMREIAEIQQWIPINNELHPFVNVPDIMQFTRNPYGIPVAWAFIAPDGIPKGDRQLICAKECDKAKAHEMLILKVEALESWREFSLVTKIKIIQAVTNYSLGTSPKQMQEDESAGDEKKTDAP